MTADTKTVRLCCYGCDRGDCDFISEVELSNEIARGWEAVEQVQTLAEAASLDGGPDDDWSVLDWYTHLGWCPECLAEMLVRQGQRLQGQVFQS